MDIGRNDSCPCGSGKKYKKCCDLGILPAGYTEDEIKILKLNKWLAYRGKVGQLREAFCKAYISNKALVLKAIKDKQVEETSSRGETLSCRPGCVYCCYHYVTATLEEIEAIVYYLYRNEQALNDFLTAYRKWKTQIDLNQSLITEISHAYNNSIADRGSSEKQERFHFLAKQYQGLDIPCPFLKNRECIIYPVRPWGCAGFVAVTPPEWCRPGSPDNPRTMSISFYKDMTAVPHYRKHKSIWTTMPKAVYSLLKSGVYSLSRIPGLETLERETLDDPEVRQLLRSLKIG